MKKFSIFFIVLALFSCVKEHDVDLPNAALRTNTNEKIKIRSQKDIESIVFSLTNADGKSLTATKSNRSGGQALEVKALTAAMLEYNTGNTDTLLFAVKDYTNQNNILISANSDCEPILAIFDNFTGLDDKIFENSEEAASFRPFLENAIAYNKDPNSFNKYESLLHDPNVNIASSSGIIALKNGGSKTITAELAPRVQVQWDQKGSPYNTYTPNNWPAGCVATAIAQAMTVTRHIGKFNGIPLEWNQLVKMKNSGYQYQYPTEARTIGLLMREIGNAVGMKYGAGGSTAATEDGIKLLTSTKQFSVNKSKGSIKLVLDENPHNLIIISSRTKKSSWLGVGRGDGHAYIVDGYRIFSDGTDLMHVNFGWGNSQRSTGYFLTKLWAPYFVEEAVDKFPHAWKFYCIRRR